MVSAGMNYGIVGAGLMGSHLAKCLVSKGHKVLVYNRTRAKAEKLCSEIGCEVVDSPKDMKDTEAIIVFVFDDEALINIVLMKDGIIKLGPCHGVVLNASTVTPKTSRWIRDILKDNGIAYYEAPVYGSTSEAEKGELVSLIGGSRNGFEQVKKIVQEYSSEVFYIGEVPKAMVLKLALNNIGLMFPPILGESLGLLEGYGVPVEKFIEVASALWFGKFVERYVKRIMTEKKKIRFTVRGAAKDYETIEKALYDAGYSSIVSSSLKNFYLIASEKYASNDYPEAVKWYLKKLFSGQ